MKKIEAEKDLRDSLNSDFPNLTKEAKQRRIKELREMAGIKTGNRVKCTDTKKLFQMLVKNE